MTDFIDPQLCLLVADLPEGEEWIYEVKWDGFRAIAIKEAVEARLLSRNGKSFERDFPEVLQALQELQCKSAIVDGEIVAVDEDGKPAFQQLQQKRNRSAEVRFIVFDLLALNGKDLMRLPLEKRRTMLAKVMPKTSVRLVYSKALEAHPDQLAAAAQAAGLEGIVAKRKDGPYLPGDRKGSWVKYKTERSDTFVVGGYLPNGGSFDELLIGIKEGRKLRYVASMKAGFVARTKAAVMDRIKPLLTAKCPFHNLPEEGKSRWGRSLDAAKMKECRWVKPTVKVEAAFVEWTEAKHLRHSRFVTLKP